MANELKPCPFCGSKRIMVGESKNYYAVQFSDKVAFVECLECKAAAGMFRVFFNYGVDGGQQITARDKAIEAWNRRDDK